MRAVCFLLVASWGFGAMQPRVVKTVHPTEDVVIASIVIDAPKDGKADATTAIQTAIDTAAKAGGGVVFLPVGRYRLEGRLTIREGVTLRGDWATSEQEWWSGPTECALLMIVADRGKPSAPAAITMAVANNVTVSPITGDGSAQEVIDFAAQIASATGGRSFNSHDPADDLADAIEGLIAQACVDSGGPQLAR